MITKYNLDRGTFILPLMEEMDEYKYWERLNRDLGAYVIAEIDYTTDNYIKIDVDYSLLEYADLKYAKQELDAVYKYVKKYFGITKPVNESEWIAERNAFYTQQREEEIAYIKSVLQDVQAEGPDALVTRSGWFDKATIDSADNIIVKMPALINPAGEYWATQTKRKYYSQQAFNDKVNSLKKELEEA